MIRKTNQFGFSWSESRPYKAPNGSKWLQIWFLSPGSHFVASAENLATTNATHILHSDQNHSGSFYIRVLVIRNALVVRKNGSEKVWLFQDTWDVHGRTRQQDSKQWLNANEIPSLLPSKIHTWKTDEQNKTKPWYMAQHRLWLCLNQHNGTQCRSTSL